MEDLPEEEQLWRVGEKGGGQPEIKGATDGGLFGEFDQPERKAKDEQAGERHCGEGIGEIKTDHGQRGPEQGRLPDKRRGVGPGGFISVILVVP